MDLAVITMKGYSTFPKTPQITGTLPSDCLLSYPRLSLSGGVLPLCRDAVGVFYCPSQLADKFSYFPFISEDIAKKKKKMKVCQ